MKISVYRRCALSATGVKEQTLGSNNPLVRSPIVDEERMRPGLVFFALNVCKSQKFLRLLRNWGRGTWWWCQIL